MILRKVIGGSSFFDEIVVADIAMLNQFKEKVECIVLSKLFEDAVGDELKIGKPALTDVHNSLKIRKKLIKWWKQYFAE